MKTEFNGSCRCRAMVAYAHAPSIATTIQTNLAKPFFISFCGISRDNLTSSYREPSAEAAIPTSSPILHATKTLHHRSCWQRPECCTEEFLHAPISRDTLRPAFLQDL